MSRPAIRHRLSIPARGALLAVFALAMLVGSRSFASAAVPTVLGISPTSGVPGTTVTITGTGFTAGTSVSFGGIAVTPTILDASHMTVVAPSNVGGQIAVIRVTNPDGTSPAVPEGEFTYVSGGSLPVVSALSPSSGPAGTTVIVYGSNLLGAYSVSFGATNVTPTNVTDNQLTVVAPPSISGTVYVRVTTPAGTSPLTLNGQFTYYGSGLPVVSSVSPSAGPAGTVVTVYGSNLSGATSVTFGGVSVAPSAVSSTQLTAVAPAHDLGTVYVLVTTVFGTSGPSASGQFTYTSAGVGPVVTGISPTSGVSGTGVLIGGSGFTSVTSVTFGGIPASFLVTSSTTIQAVAPPNTIAGSVHVLVTTVLGTSAPVAADQFEYLSAGVPTIFSIAPASGTAGTSVVITGVGFNAVTAVTFGSRYASFVVNSDSQITAIAPAPVALGSVSVVVITTGGASNGSAQFAYVGPPTITNLSVATGPVAGGTSVVITGSNFLGATSVSFGGVMATFTVNSSSLITAISPASPVAGPVNVAVTTPSGTSTAGLSSRFTYFAPTPVVTGITPSSGQAAGGTTVIITGVNFSGATAVIFGTSPASFTVNSNTQITAITSTGPVGTAYVTVTTPSGTSALTTSGVFNYLVNYCPSIPIWVNDLDYGSSGGGFWWDPTSGLVWISPVRDWHAFSPNPPRAHPQPLWADALTYGSRGEGFYWDPVSGQVWTAERGWHVYSPQNCVPR